MIDYVKIKRSFYIKIKRFSDIMKHDDIAEKSAQCAYYTILSFIPFLILAITLIQYTNLDQETIFYAISKIVPSYMNEVILGIVQEFYSKSIGTISISLVITLWSAGKGLFALTKGLEKVYKTEEKEKTSYIYLRIKTLFGTIIFIILIVASLVALVFGETLINTIKSHFNGLENFSTFETVMSELIVYIITFIIFLLLYKFLPKHKVTFKSQLVGALFGSAALNIVSFIFSKYVYIFKGFSITYGSLTTLMLIMMWTYACFYTVFLGAELNKLIT